jgi:hypothetical protein
MLNLPPIRYGAKLAHSMQATWIRNSIMHALRKTPKVSVNDVSSNVVYEHPNIGSLARYVFATVNGDAAAASETTRKAEDIVAFLARYTSDFAQHVPSSPVSEHEVVLVTGTTGALGSALLARLVGTESIAKVYAFNRPSRQSKGILHRQREALESRGYDPEIAASPKVVMVEGDITRTGLGVDAALEDEVCSQLSIPLHPILMCCRCDDPSRILFTTHGESISTSHLSRSRQRSPAFGLS